jgi:hypothetical protein
MNILKFSRVPKNTSEGTKVPPGIRLAILDVTTTLREEH